MATSQRRINWDPTSRSRRRQDTRSPLGPGIPTIRQEEETCHRMVQEKGLKPLPGLISLTTEPDCITWDDDPNTERAKMPCGHVRGIDTMTVIARSTVYTDYKFIFRCPGPGVREGEICGAIWDYALIRHVASFNDDEMNEFEKKLGELYITKATGAQQCPGCGVYCYRENKSLKKVKCPLCLQKDPDAKFFCWACLGYWKSSSNTLCGNDGCDGKDPRLNTLAKCEKKTLGYPNVLCPSVRACPFCGVIIEHTTGCKNMTCYSCRTTFCFICLRMKEKLPCGAIYNKPCEVAPVQTVLPGSN